jgi:outer membrane biosynthesis protein TonB
VISIALHLLIGPLIKFNHSQPEEEKPQNVVIERSIPTPPPTPRPTPKPTPTPPPTPPPKQTPPPVKSTPQAHVSKIKIRTPKQISKTNVASEPANTHDKGDTNGNPAGDTDKPGLTGPVVASPAPPTPDPTPTPTKPPSCANPNVAPTTINAVAPDTPPIAAQQGITGVVQVLVSLDEQSHIVETKVQSSPSSLLNNAAVQAAKQSTFRTEVKDCKPVAATYIYSVEFNNQ